MVWDNLFEPSQRLFWLYILSSLVIAFLVSGGKALKQANWRAYWLHPSALLDYRFFFINWFIKVFMLAPLLLSAQTVAIWVFEGLAPWLGMPIINVSQSAIIILYTLSLFVVSDFTRYVLHRLLHTNKYLWQFHKVHHSAPVLNPLTFYRVHPVENLLFGLRYALSAGLVTGGFLALFGPRLGMWTLMGANGFVFIFSLLGTHLRHSHIFLSYPASIERLLISPAMHQVHHYSRYARYNYGGYLAIWDWLFGSLMPSRQAQRATRFGFAGQDMQGYTRVTQLLYQPFISLYKLGKYHVKKITMPSVK